MADNIIKVNVTANKTQRVTVSSANVGTEITASPDTGRFWAQTAKNWAISENIVDGEDYSSKYYANKSKGYAQNAESFETAARETYNNFITDANSYINELTELKDAGVEEINEAVASGKDEINNTKTDVITDIEFVADGEKKEIENLIDTGKDELKEAIGNVKALTTLKIGQIGIAPLGIDETLNMERYLNGQIIIQDQFKGFTQFLKKRVALYPSIACLEDEWQNIVANSDFSQCGKFVIDDNAGTIRLPKVVNIQGLTDLSKLGEIVEAGLPNISGSAGPYAIRRQESGVFYSSGALSATFATANTVVDTEPTVQGNRMIRLDASKSNPIYGNSTTVQQEQIQYPYFIQVATGAETEDNIINEIELNNPFSLLDYKFSEYELNNLSWLRSNGQYNSKAIYPAVYDLLLKIYNGTETKTGVSVKLSTETFTDYDFVLNTAEETFRLPKVTTNRVLIAKKEITASDPSWYNLYSDGWCEQGGVGDGDTTVTLLKAYTNTNYNLIVSDSADMDGSPFVRITSKTTSTFKASTGATTASSSTFSNQNFNWVARGYISATEETNYLYFYVGETVQNANLINAGRIEEVVSQIKVDKLDRGDKQEIASWVTPDYANAIVGNMGTTQTTTFTAPAEGWVFISIATYRSGVEGYATINGYKVLSNKGSSTNYINFVSGNFYVHRGDVVYLNSPYTGVDVGSGYRFFPMKGAN